MNKALCNCKTKYAVSKIKSRNVHDYENLLKVSATLNVILKIYSPVHMLKYYL